MEIEWIDTQARVNFRLYASHKITKVKRSPSSTILLHTMSDIAYLKSKLGVHQDFPKKVPPPPRYIGKILTNRESHSWISSLSSKTPSHSKP